MYIIKMTKHDNSNDDIMLWEKRMMERQVGQVLLLPDQHSLITRAVYMAMVAYSFQRNRQIVDKTWHEFPHGKVNVQRQRSYG